MSVPWIESTPPSGANRWLNDLDVLLYGFARSSSTVSASLHRSQGFSATVDSFAIASARLNTRQKMTSTVAASANATAVFGYLTEVSATLAGSSTTTGEMIQGVAQTISAELGGSSTITAGVDVILGPPHPTGQRSDTDDHSGEAPGVRAFIESQGSVSLDV